MYQLTDEIRTVLTSVQIVFLTLKLTHVVDWPWWQVLLPVLLPVAVTIVIVLIAVSVAIVKGGE